MTDGDVMTGRERRSARAVAEAVTDPELPMLTLADLGSSVKCGRTVTP